MSKIRVMPYTPSEAAIATGRSVDNARNDRRAGYAEKNPGHARYDLLGLSRMFVIQTFADRGIGPSLSVNFADQIAGIIAFHAAGWRELWTDKALEALGVDESSIGARVHGPGLAAREQTAFNSDTYGEKMSFSAGIVVWPNNEFDVFTDGRFWDAFGDLSPADPRAYGVVSMLQFYAAGRVLAKRMPRPIFDIEHD